MRRRQLRLGCSISAKAAASVLLRKDNDGGDADDAAHDIVRFPNPLALGSEVGNLTTHDTARRAVLVMLMLIFSTDRRVKGCPRVGFSTVLGR